MKPQFFFDRSVELANLSVPPPTPTGMSQPFWEAAAERRLVLQKCAKCGRFAAYPRAMCPHCWSIDQTWDEVSGQAQVQTFTRVHQSGNVGWQALAPYVIALVRLTEGPVMLTQLIDEGHPLGAGAACRVAFAKVGNWMLPFFKLTAEAFQPQQKVIHE